MEHGTRRADDILFSRISHRAGAIHEASVGTGSGSPQASISPLFTSYLGYFVNLFAVDLSLSIGDLRLESKLAFYLTDSCRLRLCSTLELHSTLHSCPSEHVSPVEVL